MKHIALFAPVRRLPLAVAISLGLACGLATAAPAVVSFSGGTNFLSFNGTAMTVGWEFTVAAGAGVTVTDLGWWDQTPATPLGANHQVGIWSLSGTLIGSATVLTTSALNGSFRYESTTPFSLAGGTSYLIGGDIAGPFPDFYASGASVVMDPLITYNQAARSDSSSGFTAPTVLTANTGGRIGPNFLFTANPDGTVPEPSTLLVAMTGLGLLGLGRLRSKSGSGNSAS